LPVTHKHKLTTFAMFDVPTSNCQAMFDVPTSNCQAMFDVPTSNCQAVIFIL